MKSYIFKNLILFLFLLCFNTLYSQNLTQILKEDFNKREQLLIQNEVRKNLGSKANNKEIKELISNLLPWAVMEGQDSKTFAKTIVFFSRNLDAGIVLEETEDLIPLLIQFQGSEDDFLYLSKFFQEANLANLPIEVRDSWIRKSQEKKWGGFESWIGGRILIFGLAENLNFNSLFKNVSEKLIKNIHTQSELKNIKLLNEMMKDFKNENRDKYTKIILNQINETKFKTGRSLTNILLKKDRKLDSNFSEIGEMDFSLRPKIQLSPEELGIEYDITPIEIVKPTEPEISNEFQLPTNWKILNQPNLQRVVDGWIGTKYVYGGGSKNGTDCSGFTIGVLTDPLVSVPRNELPRSARNQAEIGEGVNRANVREGDLVFFSASKNQTKITHVGLALGGGKFSHASSSRGVVIQGLSEKWWVDRFVISRRIFSKVNK